MNKRAVGTKYEEKAALYLKDHGYEIIQKNYRCKIGEIDIVASQGPHLVFVEVKYRMDAHSGSALDAVGYGKQQKILKTAKWYLMEHKISFTHPCRFDVVAFDGERISLLQDAFQYGA